MGSDGNGALLKAALSSRGVDLAFVQEVSEPTGQAIILLQPGGENSIVIVGGANASWSAPTAAALEKARATAAPAPHHTLTAIDETRCLAGVKEEESGEAAEGTVAAGLRDAEREPPATGKGQRPPSAAEGGS